MIRLLGRQHLDLPAGLGIPTILLQQPDPAPLLGIEGVGDAAPYQCITVTVEPEGPGSGRLSITPEGHFYPPGEADHRIARPRSRHRPALDCRRQLSFPLYGSR